MGFERHLNKLMLGTEKGIGKVRTNNKVRMAANEPTHGLHSERK